jgi:predicted dehydrogenase
MPEIGVAIIGAGQIALANHLPGLALSPQARLVALCDANPQVLEAAARQTGVDASFADYHEALAHPAVDAVIVATPNYLHAPIVLAAVAARKHVMCEKPLALEYASALEMYQAAESAGVKHMTAFTYRFVPAMRYMKYLVESGAVGRPYHFRTQRFQDWVARPMGWRQTKKLAGSGELADMLSHRIDYGHLLLGKFKRLVADLRNFIPERGGSPSDVDDWAGVLAEFATGTTGVLESTKLATGRGEGLRGVDLCEINGSERTLVYSTQSPNELRIGRKGATDIQSVAVPREFLAWPGSPRDPEQGDPLVSFRYDQDFEFIDAITGDRPCVPSFREGVMAQAVMEAILNSPQRRRWIDVVYPQVAG